MERDETRLRLPGARAGLASLIMQDLELYQQILGIEHPWQVQSVRLDVKAGEVEVSVGCAEQVWGCPSVAHENFWAVYSHFCF